MKTDKSFDVTWHVRPHLDLVQASGIVSGLAALARDGRIALSTRFVDHVVDVPYSAIELSVGCAKTGAVRNLILDFYDRSDKLVSPALRFADVYFKRQYDEATESAAHQSQTAKVRPMGLTIAGLSAGSARLVLTGIISSLRSRAARSSRPWGDLFGAALGDVRMWSVLPSTDSARQPRPGSRRKKIVFQPRLWNTTPGTGDLFDIANQDRIETVGALRRQFSSDDTIGLVHTPFARQHAPQLLTRSKVRTHAYHRQLRSSTIGVNCVGLSGSVGWKLAEYLAAGLAVVSQPIEKELLAPLEAGTHYLPYTSPGECAAQCQALLDNPELVARMSLANLDYYQRWVDPPAHLMHLMRLSLGQDSADNLA